MHIYIYFFLYCFNFYCIKFQFVYLILYLNINFYLIYINFSQVEGAVTVQPYAEPIQGFEEYFLNLTPENNQRNPWFVEYWEDYFQCRYPNSSETPYNQNYTRMCNGSERQTRENGYVPEAQLQFVSDAVMAFAVALRVFTHDSVC